MRALDISSSVAISMLRFGAGGSVTALGERPARPLELYEFEACPFCRKVREALSALDLEVRVFPCPKGGVRFRRVVREAGGKEQFPYLVDRDAGVAMYESDAIVGHLFARYGAGPVPLSLSLGPLTTLSAIISGIPRLSRGSRVRASRVPEQPLELYSFEPSPFCRLVREVLCELELPYRLHNVAKGSSSRDAFVDRSGRMQVPYLVDPNAGKALFESGEIVDHLERTYALT
jgi:glutathione S-transferase